MHLLEIFLTVIILQSGEGLECWVRAELLVEPCPYNCSRVSGFKSCAVGGAYQESDFVIQSYGNPNQKPTGCSSGPDYIVCYCNTPLCNDIPHPTTTSTTTSSTSYATTTPTTTTMTTTTASTTSTTTTCTTSTTATTPPTSTTTSVTSTSTSSERLISCFDLGTVRNYPCSNYSCNYGSLYFHAGYVFEIPLSDNTTGYSSIGSEYPVKNRETTCNDVGSMKICTCFTDLCNTDSKDIMARTTTVTSTTSPTTTAIKKTTTTSHSTAKMTTATITTTTVNSTANELHFTHGIVLLGSVMSVINGFGN